jgi:hypothetical protein
MSVGLRRRPAKRNPFSAAEYVGALVVTVGVEAADARNVALQLQNSNGQDLVRPGHLIIYLADDADGQTLAASAPSGGWAIGTDGTRLVALTADKAGLFVSEADGDLDITITESAAKTFYMCVMMPDGSLNITAVAFA